MCVCFLPIASIRIIVLMIFDITGKFVHQTQTRPSTVWEEKKNCKSPSLVSLTLSLSTLVQTALFRTRRKKNRTFFPLVYRESRLPENWHSAFFPNNAATNFNHTTHMGAVTVSRATNRIEWKTNNNNNNQLCIHKLQLASTTQLLSSASNQKANAWCFM